MRWLIDGYNVIRRDPELHAAEAESLDSGRQALLRFVARIAIGCTDEFTVVFDGARRAGTPPPGGRVKTVFSRPPERADDVLVKLAGQLREGAAVVTSDRMIRTAARRAGATVVTAEQFLAAADQAADDDDEEDDERSGPRSGNPRRPSRDVRATERALRRLRPR